MVKRKDLLLLLRVMDPGEPRRMETGEEMNVRGKDLLTELLQRITLPKQKVRSDTAPRKWKALVHLLPHPTEAAKDILPLRQALRKEGWSQTLGKKREDERGMYPGDP